MVRGERVGVRISYGAYVFDFGISFAQAALVAVLATSTIFERLGWGDGAVTKVLATVVVAGLIVLASVAGYHLIGFVGGWALRRGRVRRQEVAVVR